VMQTKDLWERRKNCNGGGWERRNNCNGGGLRNGIESCVGSKMRNGKHETCDECIACDEWHTHTHTHYTHTQCEWVIGDESIACDEWHTHTLHTHTTHTLNVNG